MKTLQIPTVQLTDKHDELRMEVQEFLQLEIEAGTFEPKCDCWLSGYSPELSQKLGEKGIGMTWPTKYGGHERSEIERYAYVVHEDKLTDFVETYVEKLANAPQQVLRFTKRAVYQGLEMNLRTSLDMISSSMGILTELEDYQEGVNALVEKRKPSFR